MAIDYFYKRSSMNPPTNINKVASKYNQPMNINMAPGYKMGTPGGGPAGSPIQTPSAGNARTSFTPITTPQPQLIDTTMPALPQLQAQTAPTLKIGNVMQEDWYKNLPQLPDYTAKIGELGKKRAEIGVGILREGFKPAYGMEQERLAQLGQTGGGSENMALSDLLKEQANKEKQYLLESEQQTSEAQMAELQALRQMDHERTSQAIELSFNKALQEGNWDFAAQQNNIQNKLDYSQLQMTAKDLERSIIGTNAEINHNYFMEQVANEELRLKNEGQLTEDKKLELEEYRISTDILLKEGQLAGYEGDALTKFVADEMVKMGYEPIGETSTMEEQSATAGMTPEERNLYELARGQGASVDTASRGSIGSYLATGGNTRKPR